MKLIVSIPACVVLLAACQRSPAPAPARRVTPAAAPAPTAPAPAAPAPTARTAPGVTGGDGGVEEVPAAQRLTPEQIAAFARIDAGVPTVDAGPRWRNPARVR